MLKGGLATVTQVESVVGQSSERKLGASGTFGLSSALSSLMKVDMSGEAQASSTGESATTSSETRTHTPASLLYELLLELEEKKLLKKLDKGGFEPGDFVVIECTLEQDPLSSSLEMILRIAALADDVQTPQSQNRKQPKKQTVSTQINGTLRPIMDDLRKGPSRDWVGQSTDSSMNILATIDSNFLNQAAVESLSDGTFAVFGKCISSITDSSESFSLVRKTVFKHAPKVLESFLASYDAMSAKGDVDLQRPQVSVPGPAVHILPIAIFT